MGAMDFLMDTAVVGSKGKEIERIGQEMQQVVRDYNQTVQNMLTGAILGATNTKLSSIDSTIQPGMTKESRSTENTGVAVSKAATDTTQMDTDVAGSINIAE